jgi:DNA-binding transcriptional LysR family regulator
MLAKVDALRGLHSGSVSVVSGEGFAQELIDGPIRQFRQQHPGVSISLEIYGTTEIMRRVREDAAEIGLVYYPPADSHITARGAARQPMHAIVHPSTRWPCAAHLAAGADAVAYCPAAGRVWHSPARGICRTGGQDPPLPGPDQQSDQRAAGFVTTGQGVTLLPPCAVTTELARAACAPFPFTTPFQDAEMQLITRTGRHLSPSANRFLQYCMQGMQAFHGRIKYVRPYRKASDGSAQAGHQPLATAVRQPPFTARRLHGTKGQADKPGLDGSPHRCTVGRRVKRRRACSSCDLPQSAVQASSAG